MIVDAAPYFRAARAAMLKAQHQILLVGWDFDARILLDPDAGEPADAPERVGDFIHWLAERTPTLQIYVLRWDIGALKTFLRGSTLLTIIRWMRHKRIHAKLDRFHPTGGSHHQKIVVIDDCLAFCGGIDMTAERWDTRAHADGDPGRTSPTGVAYKPWHDATTALEGPAAAALGDLCRERWRLAGGRDIANPDDGDDCWPDDLPVDLRDVPLAISRSQPTMPGHEAVREIERLYLDLIARAKRTIYAESQYFASRLIAEAIARRLDEPEGPEIVLVNPVTAQGWLEPIAMDSARARLMKALRARDRFGRLRLYHPVTAGGAPIYVHAKVLVVDEEVLRVGSSNLNNRSLRLDTECDVTIDATLEGCADAAVTIRAIRDGLIAEHLATRPEVVATRLAETGSLIATIESLRKPGRSFVDYELPDLPAVQKWLADHEVLDPEGPEEMFEAFEKRSLLRRLRRRPRR